MFLYAIHLDGGIERLKYFIFRKRKSIFVDGTWLKDKLEKINGIQSLV